MLERSQGLYDLSGEHVAVLMTPAWRALGPALERAIAGLDTGGGPVLDVGAGTGPATRTIASALPDAQILAIEPDRGLRTALLTGVVADTDLSNRVTVAGTDLLATPWPRQISALVALNVLGHLSAADRAETWRRLAEHLSPTGRAVLDLSPPYADEPIAPFPMPEVTLGRRRHSGTAQARVVAPRILEWQMDYWVKEGESVVAETTVRYEWHLSTPDEVAAELSAVGLRLHLPSSEGDLFTVTR